MEHLVGGHVGKQETEHLAGIEILGDVDRAGLGHADAVRVRAPDRQRADPVADAQPRAARTERLDDADELVARGERRLRRAGQVGAGAELGIGERDARGQDPDADLTRAGLRIGLLDEPQDLRPAVMIDEHTLHGSNLGARAERASGPTHGTCG